MFCYPIIASSLYFLQFSLQFIDNFCQWKEWSLVAGQTAFSVEIYPAVASRCFERIKNSQNMIETIFPHSKYLVYYTELFSAISWQVFKGHFQIIIFSQFTSAERTLLYGPVWFCWDVVSKQKWVSLIGSLYLSYLVLSVSQYVKVSFSDRCCFHATLLV